MGHSSMKPAKIQREEVSVGMQCGRSRRRQRALRLEQRAEEGLETVHIDVHDGGSEERKHLAEDESADDGDTQRLAQFGANARAQRQRHRAEERGHGGHLNRKERADASGRNRGENRDGMDEALIQNAKNNVDGGERRKDEDALIGQGVLKSLSGTLEYSVNGVGNVKFAASGFNVLDGRTEGGTGSKIEREGNGRENSLVIDGKGGVGRLVMSKGAEGNELAGFGGDINGFQSFRGTLHLGGDFHHHVVLIQAFVDVGDLALAESVTQSVVDVLNGDAEA